MISKSHLNYAEGDPMTREEAEKTVDLFREWERTHNRENYGRYDAFRAGATSREPEIAALRESLGWKAIDRKDYPNSYEKLKFSQGFMHELCEMQRELIARQAERIRRVEVALKECMRHLVWTTEGPYGASPMKVGDLMDLVSALLYSDAPDAKEQG